MRGVILLLSKQEQNRPDGTWFSLFVAKDNRLKGGSTSSADRVI